MTLSLRERVLNLLILSPQAYTATVMRNCMNSVDQPVKLNTLASLLKKMTDEGTIARVENFGPRGGYGYLFKRSA